MSEEKWTTGDWKFKPTEDNVSIDEPSCGGSIMSGDTHIARVWNDVSENEEEYIANGNMLSAVKTMYEVLLSIEWIDDMDDYTRRFCPECVKYDYAGHDSDCRLNAALKKARGEMKDNK